MAPARVHRRCGRSDKANVTLTDQLTQPVLRCGKLDQLSISDGGVPKLPIDEAGVTVDGIQGDRQRNRRFHGGPDRAVCLWSREIIDRLQEEGHHLGPGSTGENLTVRGLDWPLIQPGSVLEIGSTVVLEVTSFARPCKTNAQWFVNRDFRRIDETNHPGWSRVYAKVLVEGCIVTGSPVVLPD